MYAQMSRQLRLSALASTAALTMLALASALGSLPVAQPTAGTLAVGLSAKMR